MPLVSVDEFLAAEFDYVIIGGGTAGLVIAARLMERTNYVVGVIEAGKYHKHEPTVNVPGLIANNVRNPNYDWVFTTVPQKHVDDRKMLQSRGKGLGGSSMLNMLAFVRPAKDGLDAFERLGNPGWNWDSLLHYMKKSETLVPCALPPDEAKRNAVYPNMVFHGTDGPIKKSFPTTHLTEVHPKALDALESLGVARNLEPSGGRTVGSLLLPTSVDPKTATRSYAASAYYAPHAHNKNLLVLTEAHVTKIRLDNGSEGLHRAVGVEFVKDNVARAVKVSKEVVLSAGSLQTPQVLELSGIGDRKVLDPLGIKCLIELPGVGENLQDHAKTPTIVEADPKIESWEILSDPVLLKKQQELYKEQKGLLASMPCSLFAFIPGHSIASESDVQGWISQLSLDATPEVFADTHPTVRRGIEKQYNIMRKWIDDPNHALGQLLYINGHFPVAGLASDPTKRYMTFLCAYTHPFSRGTVHIASADPLAPPAIQQNYLSNKADIEILTKMVAFALRMYKTKPLSELVVSSVSPAFDSDAMDEEKIRAHIRQTLATVHHPVGSASMLPREDGGVVDSSLIVYGTSNLRVVDCSIVPLEISANTNALAYAIGEKAADIMTGQSE